MIYIDLPSRDLAAALAAVPGVAVVGELDALPGLRSAREASRALPGDDERQRHLPRGAPDPDRHAWLRDVLAILGEPPELAAAVGLAYGWRSWVRVQPAAAGEVGWLDALFARHAPIVLVARIDGTAAVRLRRQAFTDGTQELRAWGYPDVVAHADGWHAAEQARVAAVAAQDWADAEDALATIAAPGLRWRRDLEAALPAPASLHRALTRMWDLPSGDVALRTWRDAGPGDPGWLAAALDRLGGVGAWLALGAAAPGWFAIEPGVDAACLIALHGTQRPAGSRLTSGWTHTLKDVVIVRADRRRALVLGESEYDDVACGVDVPPA